MQSYTYQTDRAISDDPFRILLNNRNVGPALALGVLTDREAPDDHLFAGHVIEAPRQAEPSRRRARAPHADRIGRETKLGGEVLGKAGTDRQHVVADGVDQRVAVAEHHQRALPPRLNGS